MALIIKIKSSFFKHIKFLIKTDELFKEIIKVIETISTKLPEIQFIIRPHPFEDMSVYKKIENKIPNIIPLIVAKKPIVKPVRKKIFFIQYSASLDYLYMHCLKKYI